jgi:glutaconate CoA-transferase subunit A
LAAERVLVIADDIVAADMIASDPSRVLFPGFRVSAVAHVPAACHPAPLTGYWQRDNDFFHDYHARSRDAEGFRAWLAEWITELPDHAAYRAKLGTRLSRLRIKGDAPSAPANYAAA